MIISCSRRTDIPAFYTDWLFRQIEEGECLVANPYNPKQVSRVSLRPADVDAFVFWTRYPHKMLGRLSELDEQEFKYYFLYTLNNYPSDAEPYAPKLNDGLDCFKKLSDFIGPGRNVWRYDPIYICNNIGFDFHLENFFKLASELHGYTRKVIISLISPYRKTLRRMNKAGIELIDIREEGGTKDFLKTLAGIAMDFNLRMEICCEEQDYSDINIFSAKCIDDDILRNELGLDMVYKKDKSQRKNCNCIKSKDIGFNNSCLFGCRYCYATISHKTALKNHRLVKMAST